MSISDAFDSMQEVPGVIKYFIMALSGTEFFGMYSCYEIGFHFSGIHR